MKKKIGIAIFFVLLALLLSGCFFSPFSGTASDSAQEKTLDVSAGVVEPEPEILAEETEPEPEESGTWRFRDGLPPEVMAYFEEHELSVDDNPLTGMYTTTSKCVIMLMPGGFYSWQDSPDASKTPAITGTYEIFAGTLSARPGDDLYMLESDTGPLYTVFITFEEKENVSPGTMQVFDYQSDDLYYVTDIVNDIWFEATLMLPL